MCVNVPLLNVFGLPGRVPHNPGMTQSDKVRSFVLEHFIAPARKRGDATVEVRAGDVHKALGFSQRSPLVCGALGSLKFQQESNVKLRERRGPGVGMSTTFVFEI